MKPTKASLDNEELWVLLMSTTRHAFGRRTYLPGLVLSYAAKFFKNLTRVQRGQYIEEIDSYLTGKEEPDLDDYTLSAWSEGVTRLRELAVELDKEEVT